MHHRREGAQAGGGTALAGVEWLPNGKRFGLRLDGAYNRFCTEVCDEAAGDLDVRFRFLNANLSGIAELPLAGSDFRPYLLGGVGLYNYKLEGDDVPDGLTDSESDFGLSGGLGLTYTLGQVGVFAEGRFHNVFTSEEDIRGLEEAYRRASRDITTYRYPGTGHWFAEPSRDAYRPDASDLAFDRTVTFLREQLRAD